MTTTTQELTQSPDSAAFHSKLQVLERALKTDPRQFRNTFITEGMEVVTQRFRGREPLDAEFITGLWEVLLRGDDSSVVLMRFLWGLPVARKRLFIQALDEHLSQRYPIFKGFSDGWPMNAAIPPHIRKPEDRNQDFDLVNTGYLGYMDVGYTLREVELLVWIESIRDKQCKDSPCELGKLLAKDSEERTGGCPVQVHIPVMFDLIASGKFDEALLMLEESNPLPNVTGRVCPQESQCEGVCIINPHAMSIGQVEWFLPEWDKKANPGQAIKRLEGLPDPWKVAEKPPIAIVGSGPAGLINAFLLARAGFPVTIFEAFHAIGGVLRFGIPEFRLPNQLIDDVVEKIKLLGGRFVTSFVVGKTASLQDLRKAGFQTIFVGSGAGLPKFMNIPGEHLLNVMSANEFLTRVNLLQAHDSETDTPLPEVFGKQVMVVGGGNTAMDAARTAKRLGGEVTIVYRRTQAEMPARVEELEHALEEGISLSVLRSPCEFVGDPETGFITDSVLEVMELGDPDESGRRSPKPTGATETVKSELVIMALGNSANPIIKDSEPNLDVSKQGTIVLRDADSQETSLAGIFTGGDATRGGSTAILAAGDGQAAAREILDNIDLSSDKIADWVRSALAYTTEAASAPVILEHRNLSPGIDEFTVFAPAIAKAAKAGQFVRVLPSETGELIPLTIADWDANAGTITLAVQAVGASSTLINQMQPGERFAGIAGPLGTPSELHYNETGETVVFTAGGLGLPPVYPIMREHLRMGNHVTLISGFRSKDLMFWTGAGERVEKLQNLYGDLLEVIYTTDDGTFGTHGFVTTALEPLLEAHKAGTAKRKIVAVTTIGPPMMMRAVAELTRGYQVHTVASLNSIMVDATGMCGACMVPVLVDGKIVRKHACIDGPEI
ncbi:MAG: sulfide/dihydroorotate dehydrogenase-like FAD/NAD-binding protein, partial [Propionibacteriaceae bacterium]|nr:sulfide/dihydroorotate dehydrogenase-like FAD/NAD-binding protein [Propionibacteriaceae bacterium]